MRSSVCMVLAGCSASGLTGEDLCDEVRLAVAFRTAECMNDRDASNTAGEALDGETCLLEGNEPDPTTGLEGMGAAQACWTAILAMPCEGVAPSHDQSGFWLAADPGCSQVFGDFDPTDSGGQR